MKKIIPFILLAISLVACSTSKNYLERSDEDKALFDAIKKLNKSPGDEKALAALPILYTSIQTTHLNRINSYNTGNDPARWEKIISEYENLQQAYGAIINSAAAFKVVNAKNFSVELLESKQKAAQDFYSLGQSYIGRQGRDNAKQAYTYFRRADKYIPGFKDARAQMDVAYENAVVNVIINPVQDNSFFFNSGWGNSGYDYSNEYFQQTLVRDLQNLNNNSRYAARFYTDWEARRDNVQPDWVVDLRLRDMDIPYPISYTYQRQVSASVKNGTDTSGKSTYTTVYATLNITRQSFTARANMEVNITDLATRNSISYRNFRDEYRWEEEHGSYNGDNRALSSRDWAMINNNSYNTPRREDILAELYRKIYPQVKNNISYSVDW